MTAVWLFVRPLLPYIIGAALLAGGWLYADRACWSTACKKAEASSKELEAQRDAARERATHLALLWAKGVEKAKDSYVDAAGANANAAERLRARARSSGGANASLRIRVPADVAGLLDDISRFANDPAAPRPIDEAAPTVSQAADTTLDEWVVFAVDAAAAYADAVAKWRGVLNAYEALRESQAAH